MLLSTFIECLESVQTKLISKEPITVLEHIIIDLVNKVNIQEINEEQGANLTVRVNNLIKRVKEQDRLIMHIASKGERFTDVYSRTQVFSIETSKGDSIEFKVIDNIGGIISSNTELVQKCEEGYDKCILDTIVEACQDANVYSELLDGFEDKVEKNEVTTIIDVDEFFEKADEFEGDFLVILPDRQSVAVYEVEGELIVKAYLGEQAKFKETDASIFNVIF